MTKDASKIPGEVSGLYGDAIGDLPGNATGLYGDATGVYGDLSDDAQMKIYQHMKPFLEARQRQREIAQELLRKQIEILNRESAQNHD